ncbi:MAG: hypothetical protein H7259_03150 [Cytophagales bacterium]|nr:hypothetical protein [Cytophaga sp.]
MSFLITSSCVRILSVSLLCATLSSSKLERSADCIKTGDHYFHLMRYRDAIAWYKLDSVKAEAHWKIARAYICYGDYVPKTEKEAAFRSAEKAARRCIQLSETNGNGHTWLAAALGNIAMYEGSRSKVKMCTQIKNELSRALTLNPKDDVAWSILGSFYRVLGNISWLERELAVAFIGKIPDGGFSDSEKALKQAAALDPVIMRHWYEQGLTYMDWGKKDLAKQAFTKAAACPILLVSDQEKLNKTKLYLEKLK